MKITEKEIRDIVRSELELNEGLLDFGDSPILQGLGVVKPRSEEEKKQSEVERLKKLLPPEEKKKETNTATSPEEYFVQHQIDVEGFIRDLLQNDIDDKTKIFDESGIVVHYDGSGEHDFEPDEVNKLRNDFIARRLKVFFKAYDLDKDGQYGDVGDVGAALTDKIKDDFTGLSGEVFTDQILNKIDMVKALYQGFDDENLPKADTLKKIRRKLSKIISKHIASKFIDMTPESGEYFLTQDNDLGWRKQVAVYVPSDMITVLDKNSNFFTWSTNNPMKWEEVFASSTGESFTEVEAGDIKLRSDTEFKIFGYKVEVIYDLDLPIDELEDPKFSPEAIRQRNMEKVMKDLERQEKMMDYDAQSGYQEPKVDLESFAARSMFEFSKSHPYAWKDFKRTTITEWSDISNDKEVAKNVVISNSLKMYKAIDIPTQLNSFYAQQKRDEAERIEKQKAHAQRKAEKTELLRQRTEANKKRRADAKKKYDAAMAAEADRLASIEAEAKKKAQAKANRLASIEAAAKKKAQAEADRLASIEAAAKKKAHAEETKRRNTRIQASGVNTVLIDDILLYEEFASEDLKPFFKAIKVYKPVIVSILDDTSTPDKARISEIYKQAFKGIRTKLKNLKKSGEIEKLDVSGSWGTSPGYRQIRGLFTPIFEDILQDLSSLQFNIERQRDISNDPNLYVAIPPPFNSVTEYNLNIENQLYDMRDLLLDLL